MGSEFVLTTDNVSKRFGGVQALAGVSLNVRRGDVHCLAGENGSGKSTLIKIISGVERPDSGTITIAGDDMTGAGPAQVIRVGVQVIYQDFSLFPNLTVGENIAISGNVARRRRMVSHRDMRRRATAVIEELGLKLDAQATVSDLSIADRQLTAICRALSEEAQVIFMDEPTTALTHREVESLFSVVGRLRERGVAMVFVSHKLDEVMEVSHHVTVMRNGSVVADGPVEEFTPTRISHAMTGRDVRDDRAVDPVPDDATAVLEIEELSSTDRFEDVSFTVRRGEIVGITGLLGSGRSEIAEAVFGIIPATSGRIRVNSRPVRIRGIQDAVAAGIGYVPSDRLGEGLFIDQPITSNVVAGSLDLRSGRFGLLDRGGLDTMIDQNFTRLKIKAPSVQAPIRTLSGGNQQRVVLAKWLARDPEVLVLNSPTVGVDVGSKADILQILRDLAREGKGIVVVSDDVPELVAVCHRVLVVRNGRVCRVIEGDDMSISTIVSEISA